MQSSVCYLCVGLVAHIGMFTQYVPETVSMVDATVVWEQLELSSQVKNSWCRLPP